MHVEKRTDQGLSLRLKIGCRWYGPRFVLNVVLEDCTRERCVGVTFCLFKCVFQRVDFGFHAVFDGCHVVFAFVECVFQRVDFALQAVFDGCHVVFAFVDAVVDVLAEQFYFHREVVDCCS